MGLLEKRQLPAPPVPATTCYNSVGAAVACSSTIVAATTGTATTTAPEAASTTSAPPDSTKTGSESSTSVPRATTSYYSFSFPAFTSSTNLGPLTSRPQFPSACYKDLFDMNRNGLGPTGAWKTMGCAMSTCCPSGKFYTEDWAYMTSYYSPGACPFDYQSCEPPTQTGLSLTPAVGEKIIFCCPNNAICPNNEDMPSMVPGACGSRLTSSKSLTAYTVMDNLFDQRVDHTEPYTFEPGFTEDLVIAYPIQIRFPATGTPSSNTSAPQQSQQSSGPALSTGAIIGIAVGGFFALLIACLAVYLILRSRRRRQLESQQGGDPQPGNTSGVYYSPLSPTRPEVIDPWMNVHRKPVGRDYYGQGPTFELSGGLESEVNEMPGAPK